MTEPIQVQIQNADPDKKDVKTVCNELLRDLPYLLKLNSLNAKLKKSQFDEYVKEGFTIEQALHLIK